ncbi:hypothetical protein ACI77F_02535 [Pseudomonas tritici]|uniref:hypothetical protein n=1 Tax=Pseudomonas tritici TaxID=2745518 RepID=UPI00387B1044
MDIYLPKEGTNSQNPTLPDASITPVNQDGTINKSDIDASLAYVHVFLPCGIQLGDFVNWWQEHVGGGAWFGQREVTDVNSPVNIVVRNVFGAAAIDVSYEVTKADGAPVGESGKRRYNIV